MVMVKEENIKLRLDELCKEFMQKFKADPTDRVELYNIKGEIDALSWALAVHLPEDVQECMMDLI
jgi:hypothetical protein